MIGKRWYGYDEGGWLRDQYWCEDTAAERLRQQMQKAKIDAAMLAINPPIVVVNRDDVPKWLEPQLRDKRLLLCPV